MIVAIITVATNIFETIFNKFVNLKKKKNLLKIVEIYVLEDPFRLFFKVKCINLSKYSFLRLSEGMLKNAQKGIIFSKGCLP